MIQHDATGLSLFSLKPIHLKVMRSHGRVRLTLSYTEYNTTFSQSRIEMNEKYSIIYRQAPEVSDITARTKSIRSTCPWGEKS